MKMLRVLCVSSLLLLTACGTSYSNLSVDSTEVIHSIYEESTEVLHSIYEETEDNSEKEVPVSKGVSYELCYIDSHTDMKEIIYVKNINVTEFDISYETDNTKYTIRDSYVIEESTKDNSINCYKFISMKKCNSWLW